MATQKQIDALKVGDKVEVQIASIGEGWIEIVLTKRDDPDGKTHIQMLIQQNGYDKIRLPGGR